MKIISDQEKKNSQDYDEAVPAKFGDLHQRMKSLIKCAYKHGQKQIPSDLWDAIWDLQTEVRYYKAINPPFGKRSKPTARKQNGDLNQSR